MNPDIKTLNNMVGAVIHQMENDYPTLDDAQKKCILETAAAAYDKKVHRDLTLASIASLLGRR